MTNFSYFVIWDVQTDMNITYLQKKAEFVFVKLRRHVSEYVPFPISRVNIWVFIISSQGKYDKTKFLFSEFKPSIFKLKSWMRSTEYHESNHTTIQKICFENNWLLSLFAIPVRNIWKLFIRLGKYSTATFFFYYTFPRDRVWSIGWNCSCILLWIKIL